ncbi:hypothetical protein GCM10025331_18070 [Actinoplanes utahensis]|nr:hypothetical protein Aut01nite_25280 [Actinoplanes utahensis]
MASGVSLSPQPASPTVSSTTVNAEGMRIATFSPHTVRCFPVRRSGDTGVSRHTGRNLGSPVEATLGRG